MTLHSRKQYGALAPPVNFQHRVIATQDVFAQIPAASPDTGAQIPAASPDTGARSLCYFPLLLHRPDTVGIATCCQRSSGMTYGGRWAPEEVRVRAQFYDALDAQLFSLHDDADA